MHVFGLPEEAAEKVEGEKKQTPHRHASAHQQQIQTYSGQETVLPIKLVDEKSMQLFTLMINEKHYKIPHCHKSLRLIDLQKCLQ